MQAQQTNRQLSTKTVTDFFSTLRSSGENLLEIAPSLLERTQTDVNFAHISKYTEAIYNFRSTLAILPAVQAMLGSFEVPKDLLGLAAQWEVNFKKSNEAFLRHSSFDKGEAALSADRLQTCFALSLEDATRAICSGAGTALVQIGANTNLLESNLTDAKERLNGRLIDLRTNATELVSFVSRILNNEPQKDYKVLSTLLDLVSLVEKNIAIIPGVKEVFPEFRIDELERAYKKWTGSYPIWTSLTEYDPHYAPSPQHAAAKTFKVAQAFRITLKESLEIIGQKSQQDAREARLQMESLCV